MQILTYEDTLAAGITPVTPVEFGHAKQYLIPHTVELLKYLHDNKLITKLEWNKIMIIMRLVSEALPEIGKSLRIPLGVDTYRSLLHYAIEFICDVTSNYKLKNELLERFKVWLTPKYETGA